MPGIDRRLKTTQFFENLDNLEPDLNWILIPKIQTTPPLACLDQDWIDQNQAIPKHLTSAATGFNRNDIVQG